MAIKKENTQYYTVGKHTNAQAYNLTHVHMHALAVSTATCESNAHTRTLTMTYQTDIKSYINYNLQTHALI